MFPSIQLGDKAEVVVRNCPHCAEEPSQIERNAVEFF